MSVLLYSGIFRRRFYDEIVRGIQMVLYNLVIISLLLYVMKSGDWYSREIIFVTFILNIIVSLVLKFIWKMLIFIRKIKLGQNKLRTLVVVGDREIIESTITRQICRWTLCAEFIMTLEDTIKERIKE